MAETEKPNEPIHPPPSRPGRDIARAAVEAVAGQVPIAGALVRLYQTTHPPQSKLDQAEWQERISERTNENTERIADVAGVLNPTEEIVGPAVALIVALAHDCPNGLGRKRYDRAELAKLVPDFGSNEINDAVFDLHARSMSEVQRFVGGEFHVRLTQRFYEQIDHQLLGWNTVADARALAQTILDTGERRSALTHERSGWPLRRFNPAFRHLMQLFPEARISGERSPQYPAVSILILDEDRAQLRRFVMRRY